MSSSNNLEDPEIGFEYVIEVDSIFFVCLLCDRTKKDTELKSHLSSYEHKFAFLEKNFPSTTKILKSKVQLPVETLEKFVNGICTTVARSTKRRYSHRCSFQQYKNDSKSLEREVWSKVKPYDDVQGVVARINEVLINKLKPAQKSSEDTNLKPQETNLDAKYEFFLKFPQKHPNCNEEFTKWSSSNLTFDTWSDYWKNYLNVLKENEIKKIQDETEEDCVVIEEKREVIDLLSDDSCDEAEFNEPPAKRSKVQPPKKHQETAQNPLQETQKPNQLDRRVEIMRKGYEIALDMVKQGRKPSPEELDEIFKSFLKEDETEEDKEALNYDNLTDEELVILYKNFNRLTKQEQGFFCDALSLIQKEDPQRFTMISRLL